MPDPAIFDISQLRRYTVYQNDLELELIQLFRQQLPQFLDQIRVSGSSYDWKLATHSLKGSALTVGAPVIAAMAEELEQLGHRGDRKRQRKLLKALNKAIADFDQAIQHFYH
jgi:HPt (histidine-containing phosphotransfer) domain-containing protein